jgi:hypothetical protein
VFRCVQAFLRAEVCRMIGSAGLSASDFVFPFAAAEQVPHASHRGASKAAAGIAVLRFGMVSREGRL